MHKSLKTYLPAISMIFTIVVLIGCLVNLAHHDTRDGFIYFLLELLGYLVVICILDDLISRINFRSYLSHFLAETLILYPITMVIAVWFHWFGPSAVHLILYTLLYLVIMIAIHYYFYKLTVRSADEINDLLYKKEK